MFQSPWKKKTLRIWPQPLGNCLLFDPSPNGISDALRGGKCKPHPRVEGNSFHFLMNLSRYTCNCSWSHCKFFLKLFKEFIIVKCTCISLRNGACRSVSPTKSWVPWLFECSQRKPTDVPSFDSRLKCQCIVYMIQR